MDVERLPEIVKVHGRCGPHGKQPSIIHQHVNMIELAEQMLDRSLHLSPIRDVTLRNPHLIAGQLALGIFELGKIAGQQDDAGPSVKKLPGQRQA